MLLVSPVPLDRPVIVKWFERTHVGLATEFPPRNPLVALGALVPEFVAVPARYEHEPRERIERSPRQYDSRVLASDTSGAVELSERFELSILRITKPTLYQISFDSVSHVPAPSSSTFLPYWLFCEHMHDRTFI